MPADFGYINARVKGMKSKLLEPETFNQLLAERDFDGFMGTLQQTPYASDLDEVSARGADIAAVDRALAKNFRRTARSILSFSDGAPHDLIALLLLHYDLNDLKSVARAKHAGRDAAETRAALLGTGEIRPPVLDAMAEAPDLPGAVQALSVAGHPLLGAFRKAARIYGQEGDLYAFEVALDRGFYAAMLERLDALGASDMLMRHVKRLIDATNLRTGLKLEGRGGDAEELFISGGREVPQSVVESLLAGNGTGGALQGTSFAAAADADSLSEAENAIRAALDTSARRVARRDPLDIGVVLDYLRRKESETARLRLLARGKYYDVPRDDLERELSHA